MATITQRNGKYRAQVRLRGISKSATFERYADAKAWAARTETLILDGIQGNADRNTYFADILQRYLDSVTPTRRGEKFESQWVADLLVAVYGAREEIPNNVEQFALRNPLTAVAIMMQRREMPTNSPKVAELMEMIDDPDLYSFDRPANMAERAAFELRLYKSPYLNK